MMAAPVAVKTRVELLHWEPQIHRTGELFHVLIQAAPSSHVDLRVTRRYSGAADLLMFWGPGSPERRFVMQQHQARGGTAVVWDLGYWQRETKVRVSIDAAHPQRWVMRRDWPDDRLQADGVTLANVWNPLGPVIVAGIGRKARVQYGADAIATWEADMMRAAAARGCAVRYRRKQADAPIPEGAVLTGDAPIDQILTGASLLITWHSNVAVDAIRLGIPVICQDGAAAAVCPSTFSLEPPAPLPVALRDRFLANLAYFQWAPTLPEGRAFWRFLRQVLA